MPENSTWRLVMLGGFGLHGRGMSVTRFRTQETGLLLAYLARNAGRTLPRDYLAGLAWPDRDEESARNSLRVALSSLRHVLEPSGVVPQSVLAAERAGIGLRTGAIDTDVGRFEMALSDAQAAEGAAMRCERLLDAAEAYAGQFLPGAYADWAQRERERLEQAHLDGLCRLVDELEVAQDYARAIYYARKALGIDHLREDLHCRLMRLYAAAGRVPEGLRQYDLMVRLLSDELGVSPSAEAATLVSDLRRRRRGTGRSSPADGQRGQEAGRLASGPPRGEPTAVSHLPVPSTRFFGREEEMERLASLADDDARLVTLVGPAGSGKSRLGVEAAARLAPVVDRVAWFVPLAGARGPAGLLDAIAQAMHLSATVKVPSAQSVGQALSEGRPLLVLDGFEEVGAGGAAVVDGLLARSRGLACLVTSRQPLGLRDECVVAVAPLPVPLGRETPEELAAVPSVQLLIDRVRRLRPIFAITPRNASSVAALCGRLQGVPLSIELASGWMLSLTPAQVVQRLERSLDLEEWEGEPSVRRRSLRATLRRSWEMLDPALQRFTASLAVFRGGWTVEAAESVCDEPAAARLLADLLSRSLANSHDDGARMRFDMLESVREYAAEQASLGGPVPAQRRHLAYYARMAEEAAPHLSGTDQGDWIERLAAERENLAAALGWAALEDKAGMLALATALLGYWYLAGRAREGLAWLQRALACQPEAAPALVAKALNAAGVLACAVGDYGAATGYHERCRALRRDLGDTLGEAGSLNNLAVVRNNQGDPAGARRLYEESLALCRRTGNMQGVARALTNLGGVLGQQGDAAGAYALLQESLAVSRTLGDRWSLAVSLHNLADAATRLGNHGEAARLTKESLALAQELGVRSQLALSLETLAATEIGLGHADQAVRLLAAAQAVRVATDSAIAAADRAEREQALAAVRSALGETGFAEGWLQGSQMSAEQAITYALTVSENA